MGFGLLFVGYFVATFMTLNSFGSFIRVIGYGLILASVFRLREYHRSFHWMGIGTIGMLLFSIVLACSDASNFFYEMLWIDQRLFADSATVILGYIEQGISFVFHTLMLYSLRALAKETEVLKIANNAIRNYVFICLYYVVYLIRFLPIESVQACAGELAWIAWVLYIVWHILNLILIGSCYMRICDESDVSMERKPSRFQIVNRFRAENQRRMEKARRGYQEYRESKGKRGKRK